MSNWPDNIARKAIVDFAAYSARGGSTGALHLDANESPYAPPPVKGAEEYNRYPEQQPPALRQRLADLYGTTAERIMVGRGADEAIEVLLRTFCEDGQDNILICSPTFGYYKTCAQIQGAGIIDVPLTKDYQWDTAAVLKRAKTARNLKIVFLCTPNNPTGTVINDNLVEQLCEACPETLIVVDEAYEEFSSLPSYTTKISSFQNLVAMRTLSKAYALAGVRGGVAIADPRVITLMLKVLPPYPIARPVEKAILAALSPAAMSTHAARLDEWLLERERMFTELQTSPFISKVWPSEANFLLIDVKDDETLMRELARRQVKIRDYRSTTGHMRISIGSPEENTVALKAFGIALPETRPDRIGEVHRTTKETDISVRVNLDDASAIKSDTGIGFYDHMLESLAKHGNFGLILTCKGDLEIDAHHTVEDCALALGTALKQALGDKAGIGRFGFVMPMDETQARVAIDLSGRAAMTFKGEFPTDHVGEFPAEMCPHVFESLAQTLGAAIQIDVEGENTHHMIEASFKGVARALRPAFARSGTDIASTKGVI
ncbi:histidinol-phosphate transaminase [Hellea balneolensis]|uniref:histidinol-phosphate transaminase n=1 Tax=Hellea balneolensis TaxID=287478 RepID=UPI0004219250|nr:histidinol-phosphate transaminase [Hellea balneolensis]